MSDQPTGDDPALQRKSSADEAGATSYNVDVVRSYLTQWVILAHLAVPLFAIPLIPGRLAVWGFFVISGYLNALSFRRSLEEGPFRGAVGNYYRKRVQRIYPMLILSYAIVSVMSGRFLNPDLKILIPVAYFYNFELLNGVLWTLALELQFYLLTPFLIPALSYLHQRTSVIVLLSGCVGLIYVVPLIHATIMEDLRYFSDRTTLGNIGFYLFGIVLAVGRREARAIWGRIGSPLVIATGIYAAVFVLLYNTTGLTWKLSVLFGQPLVFLICFALLNTSVKLHARSAALVGFLGYYTYEIYVFHGIGGFLSSHLGASDDLLAQVLLLWMFPLLAAATIHYVRSMRVVAFLSGVRRH